MADIFMIDDENKSTYEKLLNKSYENIEQIINPVIFSTDGIDYLIDGTDFYYSVVSDGLDCLVTMDGETLTGYIDGSKQVQIRENDDMRIISRKDLFSQDLEQLFVTFAKENRPRAYLHYYQGKENGKREVELDYDLFNFENNINVYLNYLRIKYPDIIVINDYEKLFGLFNHKKFDRYILDTRSREYMKCLFRLKGGIEVLSTYKKSLTLEELKSMIREAGFNEIVDPTLVDMYQDRDVKVKTLQSVCNTYNNYLNKTK